MTRSRALSGQGRSLVAALAAAGSAWQHGYELARDTGLRSGTLYPLLIRLEAAGYLEAEWQAPAAPGRPPRHAYRLSATGRELARRLAADAEGTETGPRRTSEKAFS